MSIIAVKGIPIHFSLVHVVKALAKTINGHFEALNFCGKFRGQKVKTCYLRLSEKLDPVRIVEKINSSKSVKNCKLLAYIPKKVPDIPLAEKPKLLSQKLCRILRIPDDLTPDRVLQLANEEILIELQIKYPGLFHLSRKNSSDHKLLTDILKKIMDRLKEIEQQHSEAMESVFRLTQWYRRMHPHFGDFQLVLGTLHALEDAAGAPRTQLHEKDLAAVPPLPYVFDNLPYAEVQKACAKYSDRIIKKITEHVRNLKSDVTECDTEDEIVRKKVREELKKMAPFMPQIVNQVVSKHFIPQKSPFYRVRIYGEPFLPSKETMSPFVRRYQPVHIMRSSRMYNALRLSVPQSHYASLMAMDGTVLNGAKLVIRSSDIPLYKFKTAASSINNDDLISQEEMQGDWID